MKNPTFEQGIIYACAQLIRMHDQPGMAADIFHGAGLTEADIRKADVQDRAPVRKALRENQ